MPAPKGFTKSQKKRLRRCEKKLKGIRGINRFAVCRASIKRRR